MPPCAVIVLTFPSGVVVNYRGSWVDQAPKTPWAGRWQMDFEQSVIQTLPFLPGNSLVSTGKGLVLC
jgi:hypothetical protein